MINDVIIMIIMKIVMIIIIINVMMFCGAPIDGSDGNGLDVLILILILILSLIYLGYHYLCINLLGLFLLSM